MFYSSAVDDLQVSIFSPNLFSIKES